MTHIGFDHHKKWTQAAAIDEQGKIIRELRVLNDSSLPWRLTCLSLLSLLKHTAFLEWMAIEKMGDLGNEITLFAC